MKKTTKLRIVGSVILLFNLTLCGYYGIEGIPLLLLTFGFAAGFEYLVVRPAAKVEASNQKNSGSKSSQATTSQLQAATDLGETSRTTQPGRHNLTIRKKISLVCSLKAVLLRR